MTRRDVGWPCNFTPQTALREIARPIASGDYSAFLPRSGGTGVCRKAYVSKAHDALLAKRNTGNRILHKAKRNQPLSEEQNDKTASGRVSVAPSSVCSASSNSITGPPRRVTWGYSATKHASCWRRWPTTSSAAWLSRPGWWLVQDKSVQRLQNGGQ
jgi:hypothetical protein